MPLHVIQLPSFLCVILRKMAKITVFFNDGVSRRKIEDVPSAKLVGDFITETLKLSASKRILRESDGKVVVSGEQLQFYKDDEGDTTVSFTLQPPPIATHAAGTAGAPSAAMGRDGA
jgi:hypothetical protein